jgi:hypothetical protein
MRQLSGVAILVVLALIAIAFAIWRRPKRGRKDTLRGDLDGSDRDDV